MEYSSKKKDWDINSRKDIHYLKFRNVSKINRSSTVSKNKNVSSTIKNDNSHGSSESSDTSFGHASYAYHDSANARSAQSADQSNPIVSQMQNFISSASDSNILKSVRTYAKKKEIISPVLCDKSDWDTERPPKNSKSEIKSYSKNNSLKTCRDIIIPSQLSNDIIKNEDSCDGFKSNFNNSSTNGYSDLNFGIFTDDGIFSLYDSPRELESSNHTANEHEAALTNEVASNGYSRTRKNLKNHLVEQKKIESNSEDDTLEVMRPSPGKTFSKASTSRKMQISPPSFLANGSNKNAHLKKVKVDKYGSNDKHSKILNSPYAIIERMPENSRKAVPPNFKKCVTALDVVQRLCIKRQKPISETSLPSIKDSFSTLSSFENKGYVGKGNTPECISSEMNNFKRNTVTNETEDLSKSKADNLSKDMFDTPSSAAKKYRLDTPCPKLFGKKRSLSHHRGLDSVKRPRVYSEGDSDVGNGYPLAKSNEKISRTTQNSLVKDSTLENFTNSETLLQAKQDPFTFLQKEDNSHMCTKTKLLQVPVIVCDCGNSSSTDNSDTLLPSLTAQVNNLASIVINLVKKSPENLQSLSSSHLKTFCDGIQRLFLQNQVENSCDLFDLHPAIATNALDSNTENKQRKEFIENGLNLHKECIYKMISSFINNLDVCELQFSVKHFCSSPNVVRFMSEFFSSCDKFTLASASKNKFHYKFPDNFENNPFCNVVKNYTRDFVKKIWPLGSKTITNQLIMEFACDNMLDVDIFIMSLFFPETELLTLKALVSRFTYIAVLSIYRFYSRMME